MNAHYPRMAHTVAFPEGRLTRGARGWSFITHDGIASHRFWPTAEGAYAAMIRAACP